MVHRQPITARWLWSQHNEHRVPLARLIMLAMYRLWPDFRVCMYLNVAMMAVLAGVLIRCAQRLRGRIVATDVFFPLVLLGLAQGLNFIWAWQVEFFASTAIALCLLVLIAEYRETSGFGTAVLASTCLALLVVCGAHGLALVPVLTLWIMAIALFGWPANTTGAGRRRVLVLVFAAFVLALVGFYFVGYQRVPYFPTSPTVRHTIKTALQFLTMAFGPAVRRWWPVSGLVTAMILTGAVLLVSAIAWRYPKERIRALGFLLFLGAMTSLGLAIGLGRNGFEPRYITLAVPVLCCVYLISTVYMRRAAGNFVRLVLLAIVCLCLRRNTQSGLQYGRLLRNELGSFESEMRAGTPPYRLIHAHLWYLHINVQVLNDYLPLLRSANVGQFRFLRDNPAFREISVPLTPVELHHSSWNGHIARTTAPDASIVFALPQSVYVDGIRLKYTVENKDGILPLFSIAWRNDHASAFTRENSYWTSPTGDRANWERGSWLRIGRPESELLFWICDRIREIRIQPDSQPCVFKLSELVLLVPKGSNNGPPDPGR
jgi:hypothetical protein